MKKLAAFLIFTLASVVVAQAQVFKCKDSTGKLQYQAAPCDDGQQGSRLEIPVQPPTPRTARQPLAAAPPAASQERQEAQRPKARFEAPRRILPPSAPERVIGGLTPPKTFSINREDGTVEADSTTPSAIPESEQQVLMELYNKGGGDDWDFSRKMGTATYYFASTAPWKIGDKFNLSNLCSWYGVTCNAEKTHVIGLRLNFTKPGARGAITLAGTLPATLNHLTKLEHLEISSSKLTGGIPSLAGLTALTYFQIHGRLTGPIPPLTELTGLEVFDVGGADVNGAIWASAPEGSEERRQQDETARLQAKQSNQLSGPIPSLAGLTALRVFQVGDNRLTGSLPSLSGLSRLELFSARNNLLEGQIPDLHELAQIKRFDVYNNQLTGPIPPLAGLKQLTYFSVARNRLTGGIPDLSELTRLKNFNASENKLTGSIPPLDKLTALEYLGLDYNRLTGALPATPFALRGGALCPNRLDKPDPAAPGQQKWSKAITHNPAKSWWDTGCDCSTWKRMFGNC